MAREHRATTMLRPPRRYGQPQRPGCSSCTGGSPLVVAGAGTESAGASSCGPDPAVVLRMTNHDHRRLLRLRRHRVTPATIYRCRTHAKDALLQLRRRSKAVHQSPVNPSSSSRNRPPQGRRGLASGRCPVTTLLSTGRGRGDELDAGDGHAAPADPRRRVERCPQYLRGMAGEHGWSVTARISASSSRARCWPRSRPVSPHTPDRTPPGPTDVVAPVRPCRSDPVDAVRTGDRAPPPGRYRP